MTGFEPVLQLWDKEEAVVILKSLSPRWESNPQIPDPKSGPFANLVTRRYVVHLGGFETPTRRSSVFRSTVLSYRWIIEILLFLSQKRRF